MEIQTLRYKVGIELGLKNRFGQWEGTAEDYGDLSPSDQAMLNARMKEYIRRNPTQFSDQQVSIANLADPSGPVEYTLAEKLSDFTDEALAQGERINPFSAANWPTVKTLIVLGILAYATVKILPLVKPPRSNGTN